MDISAIIQQVRMYTPALKTVGGAADFASGLETVVNPEDLPAAYVVPLAEDASDNQLQNGLRQYVEERIAVIVEFDNSADRRGQAAVSQVEAMKYALFQSLLNWRNDPERAQRGLQYGGGRLVAMDRGRLWWSYDFMLEVTIDDSDGWIEPAVDLVEIDVDVYLDVPWPEPVPAPELDVDIHVHPPAVYPPFPS